ncbi:MAG: 6-phosphogluconolactonase [Flavobacteriales bacterium]|nr:6-phosphogluconolactonase [Flavobacteriales bacterium]|tara:strand:- start:227 stop:928 length:702 start_codon:yes stop_codon:yes gene_type:complete
MKLQKRIFRNIESLEKELIDQIKISINDDIKENDKSIILLSGGNTPINLYKKLSLEKELLWDKVYVGLVDERFVKNNSNYRNDKLIKENLLINFAKNANFISLIYDETSIKKSLEIALEKNNIFFARKSLVLLGMGEDYHTASLFPFDFNSKKGLSIDSKSTIIKTETKSYPNTRISHTFSSLVNTNRLFLYITGNSKLNCITKSENSSMNVNNPISCFIHNNSKLIEVFWTK